MSNSKLDNKVPQPFWPFNVNYQSGHLSKSFPAKSAQAGKSSHQLETILLLDLNFLKKKKNHMLSPKKKKKKTKELTRTTQVERVWKE